MYQPAPEIVRSIEDHGIAATGAGASVCLGTDLAGVEHRETGIALLRAGRLELLTRASTDAEILAIAAAAGPRAAIAINAPLNRPRGRCCLDDDCPCRDDPGTRSREAERELGRLRVPTLATALIKVLGRRRIHDALRPLVPGLDHPAASEHQLDAVVCASAVNRSSVVPR